MSEENNAGGTRRKLEDEVETVSLAEIVQETEEWNDTAAAVLGGSDEENCSYDQVNFSLLFYSRERIENKFGIPLLGLC